MSQQTLRYNRTQKSEPYVKRRAHSPDYAVPFPIESPAACMVQCEHNDGETIQQRIIQFSAKSDRLWLSKHAFWAMCNGHRLTTYIIAGADLADAITHGVELSYELRDFMQEAEQPKAK